METKTKILMSVSLAGLLAFSGCTDNSDSVNNIPPVIPDPPKEIVKKDNGVSIAIVDAATGAALSGVTITVTAGVATDIEGNAITTMMTAPVTGLAAFYSKVGNNVKVIATKDGYVNSGSEIIVGTGINEKVIKLLEFDVTADIPGIELAEAKVATTGGIVDSAIVVEIGTEVASATPVTKIEIPAGTKMTTADGTEAVGAVTVQAVHYDDNTTESFPGGLVALAENVPANQNGSGELDTREVNFVSAGFTSIQMTDTDGNVIKNFEGQKIEIAMTLAHGTLNPESGNEVKAGDLIPIWSYDEIEGKWQYEELGEVIPNPEDNNASWAVIYQASHLSYWNLDWHYSPVCKPGHIEITDLDQGTDIVTALNVKGSGFNKTVYDYNGDGFYDLDNIPKTVPLTFTLSYDGNVEDTYTGRLDASACNVNMEVGVDDIKTKAPVKVTIVEQCSDGSKQKALPSIPGYVWSGGAWTYASNTAEDGTMDFMIAPNATESTGVYFYAYGSRYKKSYVYEYIDAGETEDQTFAFTLSSQHDDYCFPLTGSGGASQ